MATALHASASMSSYNSHCGEPDMESFLDFGAMPSPSTGPSRLPATSASNLTSPTTTVMPLDHSDDLQTPAKPSHEYERWKQQTGLPLNSVPGLQPLGAQADYQHMFTNSGIGLDDMSLLTSSGLEDDWSSGLRLGANLPMDVDLDMSNTTFLFNGGNASNVDDFVDPSAIASPDEPRPNVRVWPGMHQQQAQQAALARAQAQAQAQAQQQRQQQLLQRHQHQKQMAEQSHRSVPSRRSASHQAVDPRVEETISRVVNQIRQSSSLSSQGDGSGSQSMLPHIIKMKKDEDDMDEDERLLASEEGKKLTSKERRQLRNKVSARAFRSRRKEYIGQLEGEVALKSTECNELRTQNRALMDENARSRAFIEKLLRHQAFKPFLDDLSRDDTLTAKTVPSVPSQPTSIPVSSQPKPDVNRFQGQSQPQMQENPQIGMALVPETQLDLSVLNINNNSTWSMPHMTFFNQPQVFSVMELPEGPINPIDTDVLSGKDGVASLPSACGATEGSLKHDYPVIEERTCNLAEVPSVETTGPALCVAEDDGDLFSMPTSTVSIPARTPSDKNEYTTSQKTPYFKLVTSSSMSEEDSMEYLERWIRRLAPAVQRIESRTAYLDSL